MFNEWKRAVARIWGNIDKHARSGLAPDAVRHEPAALRNQPAASEQVARASLDERFAIRVASVRLGFGSRLAGHYLRNSGSLSQIIEIGLSARIHFGLQNI
jgi:hypothetical protein